MLEIPIMGVNAPKEHQRVIAKLTSKLYFLYETGKIAFEPLPETMIDESETSATPDLLLFDNETQMNKIIIEITIPVSEKKDFEKIEDLCEKYLVEEGFTYNYKTKKWRKYKLGAGELKENPSFCDAITYNLNDFLI
jgi:Uma2 family endonuclease